MRSLLAVLTAVPLAVGCSSAASKPAPASSAPPSAASPAAVVATPAPPAAAVKHGIGTAVDVHTNGGTVRVTVMGVQDPAVPTGGYRTEGPGVRDVGVQLRILNAGSGVFDSGPMLGLHGFDAAGQRLNIHADMPTIVGPALDVMTGVKLAPGDQAAGVVVFEVPAGARLVRLQYTPPGGQMAEWALG